MTITPAGMRKVIAKTVLKTVLRGIDPWSTLLVDEEILQVLLIEDHDKNQAKQDAFEKTLPVFSKELGNVYVDNLAWMKVLKKIPSTKKS